MAIEYVNSTLTVAAAASSIFIPATDLNGLLNTSFDSGTSAEKDSKAVCSILSTLASRSAAVPGLNFNAKAGNPSGTGSLLSIIYTVTATVMASLDTKAVTPLPIPVSGTNSGIGDVSFLDIFPNATKVVAAANYPAFGGIGIPVADLVPFFSPVYASVTLASDCRDVLTSLAAYLIDTFAVRSTGIASALTAKSRSTPVNFAVPATYTTAPNPLSALTVGMLPKIVCSTLVYSGTVQYTIDPADNLFTYRTVVLA